MVPLSVLSNWETQIQDHVADGVLTYCVYYGSGRSMSADDLKQYDIVITTYQTVVGEHTDAPMKLESDGPSKKKIKSENSLFKMKWKVIAILPPPVPWLELSFGRGLYSTKGTISAILKPKWRRRSVGWKPRGVGSYLGHRS